jgi:hypothetical protein
MQLLMEERVDEKFSIFSMQVFIDAYNAAFEVSLAVTAHAVVDDPAPWAVYCSCGKSGGLSM